MACHKPDHHAVVGYAATAEIAALAPPAEPSEGIRARRMADCRAMHEATKPSVAGVEHLDYPNFVGAYWGKTKTTLHKSFGMAGALTNGVVRDLGNLPRGGGAITAACARSGRRRRSGGPVSRRSPRLER